MSKLYALAFLCRPLSERRTPVNPKGIAAAFWSAVQEGKFPYDGGDDPAFFSAQYLSGPITWGVCRPDVRGPIHLGDWVVFFAAVEMEGAERICDYQLVAALQVARKIRHADIFNLEANRKFQQYLNLLMRPATDRRWEHHEPALDESEWHKDWLWRVAKNKRWKQKQLDESESGPMTVHTIGDALKTASRNYVIFDSKTAIWPPEPIHVARWRGGEGQERWFDGERLQTIRNLIFAGEPRSLRIQNRLAHRHFVRPLHDPEWRKHFAAAIHC